MTQRPEYGPPLDEPEASQAAEIVSRAFARSAWADPAKGPVQQAGAENFRVLRQKGSVVATLLIHRLGQFFGGRSVPMAGIGTVAVSPEHWARGAGRELMVHTVRELAEQGMALSALFPATLSFYRGTGYEPAGGKYTALIDTDRIGIRDQELPLRRVRPDDVPAVEAVYRESAVGIPGHLDRNALMYRFARSRLDGTVDGYVVEIGGRMEGYVYLAMPGGGYPVDVEVTDIAATTARATRRLLGFLYDHRSQVRSVRWRTGPGDPFLALLPEPYVRVTMDERWMLRVVDVRAALAARGYPAGLRTEIHLQVQDPLVPANDGPFVLDISDGEARVRTGGRGALRTDVRGLAALYSGHLTPAALARIGLVEGPETALRAAEAAFAGVAPWMADGF